MNIRKPGIDDGDANGYILVWHIYQRSMMMHWSQSIGNPYITHWMRTETAATGEWTAGQDRKPTAADADPIGCVLVRDRHGRIFVTGWHQFITSPMLLKDWKKLPGAPVLP